MLFPKGRKAANVCVLAWVPETAGSAAPRGFRSGTANAMSDTKGQEAGNE